MGKASVICHPTYFPTVSQFAKIYLATIRFESKDHFQKQTYRNRMYIAGPNGRQLLSIPIIHPPKGEKIYTTKIKIDFKENWQINHWRSLMAAYSNSPFFSYYKDELEPLYCEQQQYLYTFNIMCYQWIFDALDLPFSYSETTTYSTETSCFDIRKKVDARKDTTKTPPYPQVFQEKYGFLHNLSILDLLFNEGPNTTLYLQDLIDHA